MQVYHFSTFPYGGAANAAALIHRGLQRRNVDSQFFYEINERGSIVEGSKPIPWAEKRAPNKVGRFWERRRTKQLHRQYDQHIANRDASFELFSMCELTERKSFPAQKFSGGVIHLHWLAFTADYPTFFKSIPVGTPVVWTLHDMNPLTGGCHYSSGCRQFENGCGNCPQIQHPGPNDLSKISFRTKQKSLHRLNLTVVAPSRWILELAQASPIFPKSTQFKQINNSLEIDQLYPEDKIESRQKIGADTSKIVIGFGADSINNHRKGFDLLIDALKKIKGKDSVECFVFGLGELAPSEIAALPSVRNFGFLDSSEQLRRFYSSCDFFIVPSREDNQPQVGLEAMACGTPVIGFDVGGIGEYVQHERTGLLAKAEDAQSLAANIDRMIDDQAMRSQMIERCVPMIQDEFDIECQASQYIELYTKLLSRRKAG